MYLNFYHHNLVRNVYISFSKAVFALLYTRLQSQYNTQKTEDVTIYLIADRADTFKFIFPINHNKH